MKFRILLSLFGAAAGLFASTSAFACGPQCLWVATSKYGHGAAASKSTIYNLSNAWSNNGWRVEHYQPNNANSSDWQGDDGGTSIAVDSSAGVWVARANGIISKIAQGEWNNPAFVHAEFNGGKCDGSSLLVRQELGHNNLAFTDANHPYVIETSGRILSWNAGCWASLPQLPSGVIANDIAAWAGYLRAADGNGNIYQRTGSSWTLLGGRAMALGSNQNQTVAGNQNPIQVALSYALDFDSLQLFKWSPSGTSATAGGWIQGSPGPTTWNHWVVLQLGSVHTTDVDFDDMRAVVTGIDGRVWYYGNMK